MNDVTQDALVEIHDKLEKWILLRNRIEASLKCADHQHVAQDELPQFDDIANTGFDVVEALGEVSLTIEADIVNMLDALNTRRRRQAEVKEAQRRLLIDIRGESNKVACEAIDMLRHKGWLTGEDYWLTGEAGMLKDKDLSLSRLQGANLEKANLEGTNLQFANLISATLTGARFNDKTILPDGKPWTPSTDMRRYTTPSYYDFWFPGSDEDDTAPVNALGWK